MVYWAAVSDSCRFFLFVLECNFREGRQGGRGRGGRSRPSAPDMSNLSAVVSNVMMAEVSPNFQFFLYSVQILDSDENQIESRHRRKFLFDLGLWDGVLSEMPENEKDDLKRVVFFQGSFFFSARKVPGLEPEKLPLALPISAEKAEGDTIKVMQMLHYVIPVELDSANPSPQEGEVIFDKRCADCTMAFKDVGALLQHWYDVLCCFHKE
jgi:hypothetical protein